MVSGGAPLLEHYQMVNAATKVLAGAGVKVVRHVTGSHLTSFGIAGCSGTVRAVDAATLALWDSPVHTPALRWGM
jgi:dihydroxyacetone kinase-like protein